MRSFLLKIFTASCLILSSIGEGLSFEAPFVDVRPIVRIGLVDTFSPGFYINTYAPTVQYLKKRLPQYRFESVEFANDAALTKENVQGLDFLVSSAGTSAFVPKSWGWNTL